MPDISDLKCPKHGHDIDPTCKKCRENWKEFCKRNNVMCVGP